MNTANVQDMLRTKDPENFGELQDSVPGGDRRLPFGDDQLRRPDPADTTYLERHDTISLLDRPISRAADAAATPSATRW